MIGGKLSWVWRFKLGWSICFGVTVIKAGKQTSNFPLLFFRVCFISNTEANLFMRNETSIMISQCAILLLHKACGLCSSYCHASFVGYTLWCLLKIEVTSTNSLSLWNTQKVPMLQSTLKRPTLPLRQINLSLLKTLQISSLIIYRGSNFIVFL